MKPVEDVTATDFATTVRFELAWNGEREQYEQFVIAHIGRFYYAVSLETGYDYTRPQLIAKYRLVNATFEVLQPR